ncbi:MAG TPA: glutathione S-transferase family protein [Polyangiales bacterium]
MGMLVDGQWVDKWYDTASTGGRFVRSQTSFRATLSEAGPYRPAVGRYHLYVSLACPWAHRTLILRALKGLESAIEVSLVAPLMLEQGWQFDGAHPDALYGARYLHELYTRAQPNYSGRVTVPVLWDKQTEQVVNNESAEIVRILDRAFDGLGARPGSFYPEELRDEIDQVNQRVYDDVNNGVYKAGFATSREAYEEAFDALFATLDWLEQRLSGRDYLVGDRVTEADIRLFTTLVRFDAVYYSHFKCNLRRIVDYPNLRALRRRIYDLPGVATTVDLETIKQHYFGSHRSINPSGIVPKGPRDWL